MHDFDPRSFDAPRDDGHDARDHGYMLRGSESRTLTTVGAFRVVPAGNLRDGQERPLDPRRGDLYHLRQSGLGQATPAVGRDRAIVVLTERGRDLLEANRHPSANSERPCPAGARDHHDARQEFYAGFRKPKELTHDAQVYRAYLRAAGQLCERGATLRRVVVDYELKRAYQQFLHERQRRNSDSDGRPDRTPDDARLQRARQAFQPPRFPLLYRAWRQGGEAVLTVAASPAIRNALSPASGVAHARVPVPSLSQSGPPRLHQFGARADAQSAARSAVPCAADYTVVPMVVLRCTQDLLRRLNRPDNPPACTSTTLLGDWYGNVIRMGRRHALLFISQHSRLPVLIPVRQANRLAVVFPDAVCAALAALGVPHSAIDEECSRMSDVAFGRTNSRTLLGTLNDFSFMARAHFVTARQATLEDIARDLASTPILPLKGARPIDLTRKLFGLD